MTDIARRELLAGLGLATALACRSSQSQPAAPKSTWDAFRGALPDLRLHFFSANATRSYLDADLAPGDGLVFGRESVGLPPALLEANALSRELGANAGGLLPRNIHSLGDLELDRGNFAAALARYQESLDESPRDRSRRVVPFCLAGIAAVLVEQGRLEEAATLWGATSAGEDALGFRILGVERSRYERRLARLEGTPAWTSGRDVSLEEAVELSKSYRD